MRPGSKLRLVPINFVLVAGASHAILFAVIRRASILVLASVVSFLATQPVPARVQISGETFAILWQIEVRTQRPAQTRIIQTTRKSYCVAAVDLPELMGRAPQASPRPRNPRAPPLYSSQA